MLIKNPIMIYDIMFKLLYLTHKALNKFVADDILKLILLFFKENKMTFHVNHLLAGNSYEM